MILTVAEFRRRVLGPDLEKLIAELTDLTNRNNPTERDAWRQSFTRVAHALDSKTLAPIHLYLGDLGSLSVEYRLPASSSWCDLVLLGHDGRQPSAVILELKHWDTRRDRELPNSKLIDRPSGIDLHPSEQVKGYTDYCRYFHSTVHESNARVEGCVVFTAYPLSAAYRTEANLALTQEFPCFSVVTPRETSDAIAYLNLRLVKPDPDFAKRFDAGHYRQNRGFIQSIGATLRNSPHRRLVLLDEQRLGLQMALTAVQSALANHQRTAKKHVVIIEGPPGSGKSAIAANIWVEIALTQNLPAGDLAYVTTSTAQNHSLVHLFGAGQGAVKKATHFSPATTNELGQLNQEFPGKFSDVANWRGNLDLIRKLWGEFEPRDDAYLVSVIDEAHALINPESSDARGQFGFPVNFGPQAYHIIRSSVVSVFLLDEQQGFREQETTSRADIEKWAAELGAEVMPVVSLKERQFRCGGSTEYVTWLEGLLSTKPAAELESLAAFWRERAVVGSTETDVLLAAEAGTDKFVAFPNPRRRFSFELAENPAELEAALSAHQRDERSVRLVASYARKWRTRAATHPHDLPADMRDFCISWENLSGTHSWSRIWNWANAPEGYVSWVDPSPGVPMANNPLAEVGCPYTVRGFDYDYLGVLWLNDVVWRTDKWIVIPQNVHESGLRRHLQRATQEGDSNAPHHQALLRKLLQGYRILLTRALKGVYVWCEDQETRQHISEALAD